jgi:hypothetical protein
MTPFGMMTYEEFRRIQLKKSRQESESKWLLEKEGELGTWRIDAATEYYMYLSAIITTSVLLVAAIVYLIIRDSL